MLFKVITPNGKLFLKIMKHEKVEQFSFVNMGAGVIKKKKFSSKEDAIAELSKLKEKGKIIKFIEIDMGNF